MSRSRIIVALLATLLMLGACGAAPAPPQASATLPAALPTTVTAPTPAGADTALAVIPYRGSPPVITGRYPVNCTAIVMNGLPLPDRSCTPGAVGDRVTQDNIDTTICAPNWTDTIRPSGTEAAKTRLMIAYDIPIAARSTTELDHDVPLGLGGADDVSNLWVQRSDLIGSGSTNSKDSVERALIRAVCARRVTLSAARAAIAANWTTARMTLRV